MNTRESVMQAILDKMVYAACHDAPMLEALARAYEALHRTVQGDRTVYSKPAGLDSGAALRE